MTCVNLIVAILGFRGDAEMKAKKRLVGGAIVLAVLLLVCVVSVVAPVIGVLIAPPRTGQSFRR